MINPFKSKYEGSMDSNYVPNYALGAPTSPQTANQIAEATARLNAGVLGVDLALIDERLFEQVPKQHFKEIDRLMKLTGAKATIHGPIVDLAGFQAGEGGARWDEDNRIQTEKKLNYYFDMAHETDAKGNTPINFHINTGLPGEMWEKVNEERLKKEFGVTPGEISELRKDEKSAIRETYNSNTGKNEYEVMRNMLAVDQETGQLAPLKYDVKRHPGGPELYTPDKQLRVMNENRWDDEKDKVFQYQHRKAEIMDRLLAVERRAQPLRYGYEKGVLSDREKAELERLEKEKMNWVSGINEIDRHIHNGLNNLYHDLKYVPEKYKDKAEKFKEKISENYNEYDKRWKSLYYKQEKGKISGEEAEKISNEISRIRDEQYLNLQNNLEVFGKVIPAPQRFIPANDLAKEKTVETVSNVLFESWKKYKDNTPIMLLENYMPEGLIGSAEDLGKTVEDTRKRFAKKLVKEKNIEEKEAEKIAEKLIGVTWDVGHINFLRKYGYDEKKVKEETEKIAPYVKQVHITDNFGFNDAHLPPGMGNAPIKEEMAIIAKEMRKKGLDFKKGSVIVEAGSFVGQFKENPHPYALEYFESPLYTYKTMPYWKDIWETEAPYGLGYGQILPEQHFGMYGAGFSNLPVDLGGPISQDKSRFAGTPNA